jgi:hypothetical protein
VRPSDIPSAGNTGTPPRYLPSDVRSRKTLPFVLFPLELN